MNKLIKILSIIAAGISALSLLLLIICVAMQNQLIPLFYGNNYNTTLSIFTVPAAPFFYVASALAAAVVAIFTAGNRKFGVIPEIISFGYICLILPVLNYVLGIVERLSMTKFGGTDVIAHYTSLNSICNTLVGIAGLGISIIIAVCGMSFVYKKLIK